MLFKLSLKNVRKSVKDYAIYFVTLVLGVAVFYVFNAIETQTTFLVVSQSTAEALKLMSDVITGMSIFIAFVLGFLIVYASRFLMKRRNREFALYMTLGMSKRSVAGILGIESIAIGILSLAAGLVLGIGLSQLMSTLIAQLFEADMTEFAFTFSAPSFFKTILYFGIIMLVVVFFDVVLVGKSSLIQLLHAGSRAEKVRMKNPVLCCVVFALGAACLAYAYWYVTSDLNRMVSIQHILFPIFLGILGSFFVFWSVSGLLLTVVSHIRGVYYKGLNSFTFRQLSSRVNTMVVSITVICIMLFFTISILSAAFSLRTSLNQSFRALTPVDVDIEKTLVTPDAKDDLLGEIDDGQSAQEALANLALDAGELLLQEGLDPEQFFRDPVYVSYYRTWDFTLADAFGEWTETFSRDNPQLAYGMRQPMMTASDYNQVAELFGNEGVELSSDEYVIIGNSDLSMPLWNQVLTGGGTMTVFGKELHPKYPEVQFGFTQISSTYEETGLLIIPDDAADPAYRSRSQILGNYHASNDEERSEMEQHLSDVLTRCNQEHAGVFMGMNTRQDIRGAAVGLGAVVTFLGLYLGFVFLISGAAILALKALSDSIDSRGRYHMLRQLGAEEAAISGSLLKQQGLLFLFPLLLALIHSIFGIRFTALVLHQMGAQHSIGSMLLTAGVILLIYIGYFLITFLSSRRIIRNSDS